MFLIHGKYNTARVMLESEACLDAETHKQIQEMLNHPAFAGSPFAIMPDTHAGKGSVIGFTFRMADYYIPNIVGVDIGCGVASYRLGYLDKWTPKELAWIDQGIRSNVPLGFNLHNLSWDNAVTAALMQGFSGDDIAALAEFSGEDKKLKHLSALGTLGGGNHFIEIGEARDGQVYLTVHTGSRNFGLTVANFHQAQARKMLEKFFIPYMLYRDLEFIPKTLSNYGRDMRLAQRFAQTNRMAILQKIVHYVLGMDFDPGNVIESVHNYIDDTGLIRKGAISAKQDELVVIPFNMRDGLIIGRGRGNATWNESAPHGSGRKMSRTVAQRTLSVHDMVDSMAANGVFSTSLGPETLDEAPAAYKDTDMILAQLAETVDVLTYVKPIYNLKAGAE